MPPDKPDRRVSRTRETLFRALSSLMLEKRYEDITVQDIIDRANVGRSTFYAHFQDKEALMTDTLTHILDLLTGAMGPGNNSPHDLLPGRGLFDHIREHYPIFKAMTSGHGLEMFLDKGQVYWSKRLTGPLQAMLPAGQEASIPIPILANFVAGTLVTLLKWWIDNKMPYDSDRMVEIFGQLVTPGVRAGLFGDV